jgi:hypothetical protein
MAQLQEQSRGKATVRVWEDVARNMCYLHFTLACSVAFCFTLKTGVMWASETLYLCIKLHGVTETDHDLKGIT